MPQRPSELQDFAMRVADRANAGRNIAVYADPHHVVRYCVADSTWTWRRHGNRLVGVYAHGITWQEILDDLMAEGVRA